jgi:hypothetical protein
MTTETRYRQLDEAQILATLERLKGRIAERFPGSSLAGVADQLLAIARRTEALVDFLRRPLWAIRIAGGAAIAAIAVALYRVLAGMGPTHLKELGDVMATFNTAVSDLVFLSAAVFFLATLETRLKRRRALAALHELRSIAHIVDMHQLTKDPERLLSAQPDTASSPKRAMSAAELGRYLDYCSELLSLTSKLAALHIQHFNDPVTLAAVNEIESLTTGLSGKIWQKITLLERTRR